MLKGECRQNSKSENDEYLKASEGMELWGRWEART